MAEYTQLNPEWGDTPASSTTTPIANYDEIFYGPGGMDNGIFVRKSDQIYQFNAMSAASNPSSPYYQPQYNWNNPGSEGSRYVYGNTNPMLDAQENRKIYDTFLEQLGNPKGVKTYTSDTFNALLGRGVSPQSVYNTSQFMNLSPSTAPNITGGTQTLDVAPQPGQAGVPGEPINTAQQTQPIFDPATGRWTLNGQPTAPPATVGPAGQNLSPQAPSGGSNLADPVFMQNALPPAYSQRADLQ